MATKTKKTQRSSKAQRERQATKAAAAVEAAEQKRKRQDRWIKIGAVVFALLMVLSTILPALASYLTKDQNTTISSQADINAQYEDYVASLEEAVAQDPNDATAQLNLANTYFSWAQTAGIFATNEEEMSFTDELFAKASAAFDAYTTLKPDDENAAITRALCQFYAGDLDQAVSSMEQVTSSHPNNASAWANLGMLYENAVREDDARAAYQKAIELDPEDELSVKSYATERLEAMDALTSAETEDSGSTDTSADTSADAASSEASAEATGEDSAN